MRLFCITDIHGNAKTFQELLRRIDLQTTDTLYLLGDYIDRGHRSKEVFDIIFDLQTRGFNVVCLKGNHEQMLLAGLNDADAHWRWQKNGGKETLRSFGATHATEIPSIYLDFMQRLPTYDLVDTRFALVHAGFDPYSTTPFLDTEAHLWIRYWSDMDFKDNWLDGRTVIHGHTPLVNTHIEADVRKRARVIDIDNGSYIIDHPKYGQLFALELNEMRLFSCPNID
jgi:serine/threonine protein phosphatase 1